MNKKIIVGTIIVLVLLAAGAQVVNTLKAKQPTGNIGYGGDVVCTMDALICPDGSAVGRSGPECKFATCPNTQNSYTGKLLQIEGKFYLETKAPDDLPEGAEAYRIPLEVKVSNVLGQLINQQVTVKGTFTEGNTLNVASLEEATTADPDSIEVGVGETKTVRGVSITLNKVAQDYRCPIDVQCIEAGAIVANVTFKSGTNTKTFNMPSDEVPQQFAGFEISIENVKPSRVAAKEPDAKSYKVTFKITK